MNKERVTIPANAKRLLLIECGYKCSVPNCSIQWPTLQFHHIDENPANNEPNNILLLCPTHHQMVTSKYIDRKSCELLKQSLTAFSSFELLPQVEARNRLLYSLAAELYVNMNILNDKKFSGDETQLLMLVVYPHLLHATLDQAISSGVFIHELDAKLFKLLYTWAETLNEFNHRLDLTEFYTVIRQPTESERSEWHQKLIEGRILLGARQACTNLVNYLLANYSQESGINADTVMFPNENTPSKPTAG